MTTAACAHVAALDDLPEPSTLDGCEDCVVQGTRWVHLRLCLTCGKVACCDSSPQQHASRHAADSGHPVIRSFEPGESWRWCFVDQSVV